MERLFNSKEFSDAVIYPTINRKRVLKEKDDLDAKGEVEHIHVSRLILSHKSAKFETMFEKNAEQMEFNLEIPNRIAADKEAILSLRSTLRFLYMPETSTTGTTMKGFLTEIITTSNCLLFATWFRYLHLSAEMKYILSSTIKEISDVSFRDIPLLERAAALICTIDEWQPEHIINAISRRQVDLNFMEDYHIRWFIDGIGDDFIEAANVFHLTMRWCKHHSHNPLPFLEPMIFDNFRREFLLHILMVCMSDTRLRSLCREVLNSYVQATTKDDESEVECNGMYRMFEDRIQIPFSQNVVLYVLYGVDCMVTNINNTIKVEPRVDDKIGLLKPFTCECRVLTTDSPSVVVVSSAMITCGSRSSFKFKLPDNACEIYFALVSFS